MEEVGYMKKKVLRDAVSRSDASGHRTVSSKGWTPSGAPRRSL